MTPEDIRAMIAEQRERRDGNEPLPLQESEVIVPPSFDEQERADLERSLNAIWGPT